MKEWIAFCLLVTFFNLTHPAIASADPPPPLLATLIGPAAYRLTAPMPFDVRISNLGTTTYRGLRGKLVVRVVTPPAGIAMPKKTVCAVAPDSVGSDKLGATIGNDPNPGLIYVSFEIPPASSITIKAQADLRCGSVIVQPGEYVIHGYLELESLTNPTVGLAGVYTAPAALLISP